jgi:hypothetical protein
LNSYYEESIMLKAISTITNALGALNYKGTWNASSNTPTLADGTGAKGDYYVTSTAGTQTFGGIQLFFGIGDWIVYNGAVWQRVEGGSDGNFSNVTLTSTDAGAAAAPLLDLYRDSATPAASDTLGQIEFNGEDSAGNKQQYALIHASILSPTSTAETGQLHFETATAGASTEKMIIGTSNLVINEIGAIFNVRIEGDTDANLFFTDATNSRVGVGTISPAYKLEVNGTVGVTGTITPGQTTGIVGTTTNNSVQAGSVGEYVSATLASGSAVSLVTATAKTVTSISLTAGDWDVTGVVNMFFGATTNIVAAYGGASIVDNTLGANNTFTGTLYATTGSVLGDSLQVRTPVPTQRISIASTTTVYLIAFCSFTVSTTNAHGEIRARRIR